MAFKSSAKIWQTGFIGVNTECNHSDVETCHCKFQTGSNFTLFWILFCLRQIEPQIAGLLHSISPAEWLLTFQRRWFSHIRRPGKRRGFHHWRGRTNRYQQRSDIGGTLALDTSYIYSATSVFIIRPIFSGHWTDCLAFGLLDSVRFCEQQIWKWDLRSVDICRGWDTQH